MKTIELQCENCGTTFERALKEHKRNQKVGRRVFCNLSCSKTFDNHLNPKGNAERLRGYRRKPDEFSPFKYFIYRAKHKNSESKWGASDLTLKYLKNLWEQQQGKCSYTHIDLVLPPTANRANLKMDKPARASLDRIDSSKGYIQGNVEFVCYSVNLAKNGFSKLQMQDFFDKVAKGCKM